MEPDEDSRRQNIKLKAKYEEDEKLGSIEQNGKQDIDGVKKKTKIDNEDEVKEVKCMKHATIETELG